MGKFFVYNIPCISFSWPARLLTWSDQVAHWPVVHEGESTIILFESFKSRVDSFMLWTVGVGGGTLDYAGLFNTIVLLVAV